MMMMIHSFFFHPFEYNVPNINIIKYLFSIIENINIFAIIQSALEVVYTPFNNALSAPGFLSALHTPYLLYSCLCVFV